MPGWVWTLLGVLGVLGVLGGLVLGWLVLMAVLWRIRPDELRLRELLRLLPDFVPVLG